MAIIPCTEVLTVTHPEFEEVRAQGTPATRRE